MTLPNGPLTRDEAISLMKSGDSPFATTTTTIRGTEFEVFANAPGDMREFFNYSNEHFPDNEFLIYGDERLTYGEVHRKSIILSKAGVLRVRHEPFPEQSPCRGGNCWPAAARRQVRSQRRYG